jgi:hypothetical protein
MQHSDSPISAVPDELVTTKLVQQRTKDFVAEDGTITTKKQDVGYEQYTQYCDTVDDAEDAIAAMAAAV